LWEYYDVEINEVREIAWLASIVGGLSVVSVGIAITLAVG